MGDGDAPVGVGHAPRRGMLAVAFAGLGVWLARVVAGDQPWVAETLRGIGEAVPWVEVQAGVDPGGVALVLLGGLLLVAAFGAFLIGQASGGAFAVLVAGVVAWFVFPYAEMPWALVLTGQDVEGVQAPGLAWWLAGGLVFLATVEVVASARGAVVSSLREQGFGVPRGSLAWRRTRARLIQVVLGAGLVGMGVVVSYRWLHARGAFELPVPDLLWVPVAVGLLVGGVLWWTARRA